jgi:DNA polymerase V
LKKGVTVFSSNYTLYGDISARVMTVLKTFTPDLEIYSIDEAFLSLKGFGDRLVPHAHALRTAVLQWTGIPVSVGIAPTKTLAKVANRNAKKMGTGVCCLMDEADQMAALQALPLTDLWGVAGRMERRLLALNITTPLHLRDADPKHVRQELGVVMERMVLELRGVACHALVETSPANKQIVCSRSFSQAVTALQDVEEAVATFTERAAAKLRRQNLQANRLGVFVRTNPFKPGEAQYSNGMTVSLPVATADTARLLRAARWLTRRLWRDGYRYKKAGVELSGLTASPSFQADLWAAPDSERCKTLMRVMDTINAEHGRGTLRYAISGTRHRWGMKAESRSNRYTTEWDELLEVG